MCRPDIRAIRFIGLTMLLACGTTAMASSTDITDGPTGHPAPLTREAACEQWSPLPACYVSWHRLLANPAAYRGKIVWLTGYLVSDFGNLILYPDKANYESGGEIDSVLLKRPFAIPGDIADKASAGIYPVIVMGRFSPEAETVGFDRSRAGSLYDIHKITHTQRVPSGEPLNRDGIHIQSPEN